MSEVLDNRRHGHYRGDRTAAIGQVMGPTYEGELLVADEATYYPDEDRTTIWFRYATADDVVAYQAAQA